MKLTDFRDDGSGNIVLPPQTCEITITATNIDDIFRCARRKGIKEMEVTEEQMFLIAQFLAANTSPYYDMEHTLEEVKEIALKLMKEGKVDMFFGIKLKST